MVQGSAEEVAEEAKNFSATFRARIGAFPPARLGRRVFTCIEAYGGGEGQGGIVHLDGAEKALMEDVNQMTSSRRLEATFLD